MGHHETEWNNNHTKMIFNYFNNEKQQMKTELDEITAELKMTKELLNANSQALEESRCDLKKTVDELAKTRDNFKKRMLN